MYDYSYWDPPLWLGVLTLYILPIWVCFYKCIKNKRKFIPSFLMSIFYPTTVWVAIIIFFGGIFFAIELFEQITFIPKWLGVTLSFIIVGGGLTWILGRLILICDDFYDNYKDRGIYSIKRMPPIKKD